MPATAPRKNPNRTTRTLIEAYPASAAGSPLKIDRDAGVIYGVKVLGRYSRGSHSVREAENGTEYTPECMRAALPLYEGAKVFTDHPADRSKPGVERGTREAFGVLRNARVESDDDGVRADLHYLRKNQLAEDVLDDVERGLGIYGLSHNAASDRERIDRANRRLVIESIAVVRSVDLVTRPATNRNLWESQEPTAMTITIRSLLESQAARFLKSPARSGWLRALLEDDALSDAMTGEMDAPAAESDPDAAMWGGFWAAISAIGEKYKAGEMDAAAAAKAVAKYFKTHEKLSQADEPEDVTESDDEPDKKDDKGKTDTMESLAAENARLKREAACRTLCESESFTPKPTQLKALVLLESDAERKELIGSFKVAAPAPKPGARSVAPGGTKPKAEARNLTESESAAEAVRMLRG